MNLFDDASKARDCAISRFIRQKHNEPLYIYRATVMRREMWAVLSAAEAAANKISSEKFYFSIDGRYGLADIKEQRQKRLAEHPEYPCLIQYARGLRQQLRAEEKLDKMRKGASGAHRPPEVPSDSGQAQSSSC